MAKRPRIKVSEGLIKKIDSIEDKKDLLDFSKFLDAVRKEFSWSLPELDFSVYLRRVARIAKRINYEFVNWDNLDYTNKIKAVKTAYKILKEPQ